MPCLFFCQDNKITISPQFSELWKEYLLLLSQAHAWKLLNFICKVRTTPLTLKFTLKVSKHIQHQFCAGDGELLRADGGGWQSPPLAWDKLTWSQATAAQELWVINPRRWEASTVHVLTRQQSKEEDMKAFAATAKLFPVPLRCDQS